jgi:hypothetical protein
VGAWDLPEKWFRHVGPLACRRGMSVLYLAPVTFPPASRARGLRHLCKRQGFLVF